MARLPLIDPDTTGGDIRAAFDRMPVKLNIFRMMAHAEANAIPLMRLGNSILHKQKLSAVNRELLILQAAQLEGGAYEWRQHVPIALGVGVTQAQIDAVAAKGAALAKTLEQMQSAVRAKLQAECERIDREHAARIRKLDRRAGNGLAARLPAIMQAFAAELADEDGADD